MQEYTSLETSRKLFEMFGWEPKDWYDLDPDGEPEEYLSTTEDMIDENDYVPAYTLPYLLDKLPSRWWIKYRGDDYVAKWDNRTFEYFVSSSTPIEAVALLCLELGKQGILPKVNKTPGNVAISDRDVNKITSKQIMYCVVGEEGIEFTSESEQEAKQFIADEIAGVGRGDKPADPDYYYITTMTKAELDALPEV